MTIPIPLEDLRSMAISSLRYALGRLTYITGATVNILMRFPKEVWDEKTLYCALIDLETYFGDREHGLVEDMDYDYEEWKKLYRYLESLKDKSPLARLQEHGLTMKTNTKGQMSNGKYWRTVQFTVEDSENYPKALDDLDEVLKEIVCREK